jgi:hypothetical protein
LVFRLVMFRAVQPHVSAPVQIAGPEIIPAAWGQVVRRSYRKGPRAAVSLHGAAFLLFGVEWKSANATANRTAHQTENTATKAYF